MFGVGCSRLESVADPYFMCTKFSECVSHCGDHIRSKWVLLDKGAITLRSLHFCTVNTPTPGRRLGCTDSCSTCTGYSTDRMFALNKIIFFTVGSKACHPEDCPEDCKPLAIANAPKKKFTVASTQIGFCHHRVLVKPPGHHHLSCDSRRQCRKESLTFTPG